MGKKVKNKKYVNKCIEYFNNTTKWSNEFSKDYDFSIENIHIDYREFPNLVMSFYGYGLNEKQFKDACESLYERLTTDHEKVFDEYYNKLESIDYNKLNYNDQISTFNTMLNFKMSQFNSSTLEYNKQYKAKRYGKTVESMMKYDKMTAINLAISSADSMLLGRDVGYNFRNNCYLSEDDIELQNDEYGKNELQKIEKNYQILKVLEYNNGLSDNCTIEAPKEIYDSLDKNGNELSEKDYLKKMSNDEKVNDNVLFLNSLFNNQDGYSNKIYRDGSKTVQGMEIRNIYIDGKPLYNEVSHIPGEIKQREQASAILALAMKNGKSIDVVSTYIDRDFKAQTKITPLNIVPPKEIKKQIDKKYFESKHSKLRLLFNWGPFKIKEKGYYEDMFTKKQETSKERFNMILEHRNGYFLEDCNKIRDFLLDILPGELVESKVNTKNKTVEPIKVKIDNNEIEKNKIVIKKDDYKDNTLEYEIENSIEL